MDIEVLGELGESRVRYVETFYSIQGEGIYAGEPSLFLRLWGCNFTCPEFGGCGLSKELDYDPATLKSLADVPPTKSGCDTPYSWDKRYRHLTTVGTISTMLADMYSKLLDSSSRIGKPTTPIVITGGEPMLSQDGLGRILTAIFAVANPSRVTIETNGSIVLSTQLGNIIKQICDSKGCTDSDTLFLFSISPKLPTSGEYTPPLSVGILTQFAACIVGCKAQIKFVVDASYVEPPFNVNWVDDILLNYVESVWCHARYSSTPLQTLSSLNEVELKHKLVVGTPILFMGEGDNLHNASNMLAMDTALAMQSRVNELVYEGTPWGLFKDFRYTPRLHTLYANHIGT